MLVGPFNSQLRSFVVVEGVALVRITRADKISTSELDQNGTLVVILAIEEAVGIADLVVVVIALEAVVAASRVVHVHIGSH